MNFSIFLGLSNHFWLIPGWIRVGGVIITNPVSFSQAYIKCNKLKKKKKKMYITQNSTMK